MRPAATFLIFSMAVMAACSRSQAPAPGGVSAPAAAPFSGRPHPKPGLWEMTMTNTTGPGVSLTGQICLDAQTEGAVFQVMPGGRERNCDEPRFSPGLGGALAFDVICRTDKRTITTHAVLSGDFTSSYVMDLTSRLEPPPPGMSSRMKVHTQARWLGPCKPGQVPGRMALKFGGFG